MTGYIFFPMVFLMRQESLESPFHERHDDRQVIAPPFFEDGGLDGAERFVVHDVIEAAGERDGARRPAPRLRALRRRGSQALLAEELQRLAVVLVEVADDERRQRVVELGPELADLALPDLRRR